MVEPTVLPAIIAIKMAVGEGTIDKEGVPALRVLTIEALGQQLGDDDTYYHATFIMGSDQARQLIRELAPRAAAMATPMEQLSATVTDSPTDQKEDA